MRSGQNQPEVDPAAVMPNPEDAFSEDGVDLTLIHWMLKLSPRERLQFAQDMVDTAWLFRKAREA